MYPPEFIQTNEEKQNRTFSVGHAMWTVIQCYWMNKESIRPNLRIYGKVLEEYQWLKEIGDIEMEWDLQWMKFWDVEFFSCSNDYTIEIEFWEYLFIMNGQSDVLWYLWDNLFVWDIKTASGRWKWLEKKIQCEMYPLMLEQLVDHWEIDAFYYFVFLKNKKKWVCQVLKHKHNREESLKKLYYYLNKYIQHENIRNSTNVQGWPVMSWEPRSNDIVSDTRDLNWRWFSSIRREDREEL